MANVANVTGGARGIEFDSAGFKEQLLQQYPHLKEREP